MRTASDAVFAVLLVVIAFLAFLLVKEWDLVWNMAFHAAAVRVPAQTGLDQ